MSKSSKNLPLRLTVAIGVPLCAIALAVACLWLDNTPPCRFYDATGLYCIGCGTGRALLALLHGRIYAAFRYQPLLIVSLPFLVYYIAKVYLEFVFARRLLPFPKIRNNWFGVTVVAIFVAFWILRNIPIPPFSYLAPTAV